MSRIRMPRTSTIAATLITCLAALLTSSKLLRYTIWVVLLLVMPTYSSTICICLGVWFYCVPVVGLSGILNTSELYQALDEVLTFIEGDRLIGWWITLFLAGSILVLLPTVWLDIVGDIDFIRRSWTNVDLKPDVANRLSISVITLMCSLTAAASIRTGLLLRVALYVIAGIMTTQVLMVLILLGVVKYRHLYLGTNTAGKNKRSDPDEIMTPEGSQFDSEQRFARIERMQSEHRKAIDLHTDSIQALGSQMESLLIGLRNLTELPTRRSRRANEGH